MSQRRPSLRFLVVEKTAELTRLFHFQMGNYLLNERIATIRSPKAIIKESVSNTVMGITSLAGANRRTPSVSVPDYSINGLRRKGLFAIKASSCGAAFLLTILQIVV